MAFTCVLCGMDIQVGERMLADDKMALAHERCVEKEAQLPKEVHVPTIFVPPPIAKSTEAAVQAAKAVSFKMQHNIPVPVAEAKMVYAEPCLLPTAPKVCTECQKPAISMCPCGAIVHHDFGYNGVNCSGRHETKCAYAAASRELPKKSIEEKAKQDLFVEIFKGRNGKHQKPTKRNRR